MEYWVKSITSAGVAVIVGVGGLEVTGAEVASCVGVGNVDAGVDPAQPTRMDDRIIIVINIFLFI